MTLTVAKLTLIQRNIDKYTKWTIADISKYYLLLVGLHGMLTEVCYITVYVTVLAGNSGM